MSLTPLPTIRILRVYRLSCFNYICLSLITKNWQLEKKISTKLWSKLVLARTIIQKGKTRKKIPSCTQLVGGVLVYMQMYFEVMWNIFKIARSLEMQNLIWFMKISFHQSPNRFSCLQLLFFFELLKKPLQNHKTAFNI